MALFLTEADVVRLFPMKEAVSAVETAFRRWGEGDATNHPRQRLRVQRSGLQLMAAADAGLGVMGFKAYSTGPQGKFLVHLYSMAGGQLLAILEANWLGAIRTGAASGVATRHMARQDASVVGVIGAGFQARTQLEAVCTVRPVKEARAYSRHEERRQAFAQEMTVHLGIPVRAAASAEECVRDADILVTITNSREPVFDGRWLAEGAHVNAAGGNHWMRREIDETTIQRSSTIVADSVDDARIECGELIWAAERGVLRWERVRELRDVVAGRLPGRAGPLDITLFESQGLALEDVAAAHHIYQRAQVEGVGQPIL
ncbi:MAG: ornithine cyclodeaminase family protein [Chloroflexi bacterium]|nr:ornithine cyclodeaminase family protein [Chloroflexota bacterium]